MVQGTDHREIQRQSKGGLFGNTRSEELRTDSSRPLASSLEAGRSARVTALGGDVAVVGSAVQEGGLAINFLKRDAYFENQHLYAQYISHGADLYDKALSQWAGSGLTEVIRPSALALVYASSARDGKDQFYIPDPSLTPGQNAAQEMQLMLTLQQDLAKAQAELIKAGRVLRQEYSDIRSDRDRGERALQILQAEGELKRYQTRMEAAEANLRLGIGHYKAAGAAEGIYQVNAETLAETLSLISDATKAKYLNDPEAMASVVQRAKNLLKAGEALAENPKLVGEYFNDQFDTAAALEAAGAFDQAAQVRAEAVLTIGSVLSGAASIVRAGSKAVLKITGASQAANALSKEAGTLIQVGKIPDGSGAPLPAGYNELKSAGAAANTTGGLPDGYRRVTAPDGDIAILAPDGKVYASIDEIPGAGGGSSGGGGG